ncbi:MAG TPA: hypothetical protein VL022_05700 [Moheibacter sp.]|nr:hypothetical protein [Moheibacter sp.]
MNFARRLRFYLIGVSIGVVVVLLLFGPRALQCSYFPNSRALEEAKIYPMNYGEGVLDFMQTEGIDSVYLYNKIFKKSTITNFGTDEVRATPCRLYRAAFREEQSYDFVFEICKKETFLIELKKAE